MSYLENIIVKSFYHKGTKDQDISFIIDNNEIKIFGVLDGHGNYGKEYVNKVKDIMTQKLITVDFSNDYKEQIIKIFNDINNELNIPKYESTGTTVTLLIMLINKLIVINVGDSDIYLFNENHELEILNETHNGINKNEMIRLKNFPETKILYASSNGNYIDSVWTNDTINEINRSKNHYYKNRMLEPAIYIGTEKNKNKLAMTRSIGDYILKPDGIISIPEIKTYHIPNSPAQILIASDGFWDNWTIKELIIELSDIKKRHHIHETSIELSDFYYGKLNADDNTLIHIFI